MKIVSHYQLEQRLEFAQLKVSKTEVIQNNEESLTERQERSAAAKVELATVEKNMERADETYAAASKGFHVDTRRIETNTLDGANAR